MSASAVRRPFASEFALDDEKGPTDRLVTVDEVFGVGAPRIDDTADFVREFDEVDFVTEATAFERSVEEMLSDASLTELPGSPLGGFPG